MISKNIQSLSTSRDGSCKKHQNKGSSDGKHTRRHPILHQVVTASLHKCDLGMSPSISFPSLLPLFWCFLLPPSLFFLQILILVCGYFLLILYNDSHNSYIMLRNEA